MNLSDIKPDLPAWLDDFTAGWWYHFQDQYYLWYSVSQDTLEYLHKETSHEYRSQIVRQLRNIYKRDAHLAEPHPELIEILP